MNDSMDGLMNDLESSEWAGLAGILFTGWFQYLFTLFYLPNFCLPLLS